MSIAYITHPDFLLHEMGEGHPERPERLSALEDTLLAARLDALVTRLEAPPATREQLLRVHDADYVDALHRIAPRAGLLQLDPDTAMNPYTLQAALLAGSHPAAFGAVRPPGHHAERARAMGFCFFNNVAVGVAHALARHGLSRVAVADFDVHHGNGTQDIFRDDERVLMVSTFQHPFYPGSGVEGRSERMVNVPLPAGSDGCVFREVVRNEWLPALERFRPELLFISAGFDAHREDGMANLRLVESDYAWVTRELRAFASGRIVSMLEGGYNLSALGRSFAAHLRELAGDTP